MSSARTTLVSFTIDDDYQGSVTSTGTGVFTDTTDLVGMDRPGIVRDLSGLLARHGANIEELVADTSSAPMSGEVLFRAHARLTVPPASDLGQIRTDLERFSSELMVEPGQIEAVTGPCHRDAAGIESANPHELPNPHFLLRDLRISDLPAPRHLCDSGPPRVSEDRSRPRETGRNPDQCLPEIVQDLKS